MKYNFFQKKKCFKITDLISLPRKKFFSAQGDKITSEVIEITSDLFQITSGVM